MNKKNLLFTIALLIAFSISSILAIFTAKKLTKIRISSVNHPDFFMHNVTYTKFNQEGNIRNQIHAKKITHLTQANTYLFANPHVIMNNPHEQPWHITADQGKSELGKTKVELWENVKITKAADDHNPDFDIATTAITIYPETKFAETNQPVTIIQTGNITKSIGATADFKRGVISLLEKVEGVYKLN